MFLGKKTRGMDLGSALVMVREASGSASRLASFFFWLEKPLDVLLSERTLEEKGRTRWVFETVAAAAAACYSLCPRHGERVRINASALPLQVFPPASKAVPGRRPHTSRNNTAHPCFFLPCLYLLTPLSPPNKPTGRIIILRGRPYQFCVQVRLFQGWAFSSIRKGPRRYGQTRGRARK